MPTPYFPRQTTATSPTGASNTQSTSTRKEWRCIRCDKVLGVHRDDRMHLRFARSHEYFVGYPVVATCRGCGTLNQAMSPAS